MAINYLEKEKKIKKVLHTEESIEHGTVAIDYLEKILEKKKKKVLHTEESIEHGTTDTNCESMPSKLSVTTPPFAVF